MSLVRLSPTVLLGIGFAVTACGCAAPDVDDFVSGPPLEAQVGVSGSGGVNGASPSAYHANVGKLLAALGVAAANPVDPSAVNPALEAMGLLSTSEGRHVFKYAARCALPAGTTLSSGNNTYQGGGILNTTSGWLTAGLATSQKEDVLTCLVAHLNPLGQNVPIFLSGPSVSGAETSEDLGFSVAEAVWQARIPGPGLAPVYYAWPRVNLLDTCGLFTDLTWISRICGGLLNTCGVNVRYDMASACTGSNGNYTCNGKPAIQTTLEDSELCSLHVSLL